MVGYPMLIYSLSRLLFSNQIEKEFGQFGLIGWISFIPKLSIVQKARGLLIKTHKMQQYTMDLYDCK